MNRLTIEEVQQIKDDWNDPNMGKPNNFWENRINSLFDTIQAQQQEIREARDDRDSQQRIAIREMEKVKALAADKDEQAGRIMELEELAKDLYFAYLNKDADCPHSFETQAVERYHALLGGAEDERADSKRAVDRPDS